MNNQKSIWTQVFVLMGFLFFILIGPLPDGVAQEHPEHPKSAPKTESTVTKEEMAKAIEDYVQKDSQLKGGFFLIFDPKAKKTLELSLDKVHQDRLSMVSDNLYFACSDFKATNGKSYDLDFFMKATNSRLQVTQISIHKENGKPRYQWQQKNGTWLQKELSE